MKQVIILFTVILVISCGKTDDPLDGECRGIIDFTNAGLFQIELVGSTGTNLIKEGIYDPNQITASFNGDIKRGVFENFDASVSRDTIRLYTAGNEGLNRWLIHLTEMDTDTLDFTISYKEERAFFDGVLLCGERHILNSASYNGMPLEFTSEAEGLVIVNLSVLK